MTPERETAAAIRFYQYGRETALAGKPMPRTPPNHDWVRGYNEAVDNSPVQAICPAIY